MTSCWVHPDTQRVWYLVGRIRLLSLKSRSAPARIRCRAWMNADSPLLFRPTRPLIWSGSTGPVSAKLFQLVTLTRCSRIRVIVRGTGGPGPTGLRVRTEG